MIIAHAGHRLDRAGRSTARFPADRVGSVYRRVYLHLMDHRPDAVVTAPANGADLIVLRAAEDLFVPCHVVLPIPADAFRARSVDEAGPDWIAAFERALTRAASVVTADDNTIANDSTIVDDWYLRGNDLILDTAQSLAGADQSTTAVGALAVMTEGGDAQSSATADFRQKARQRHIPVHTVDPLSG